MRIAPPSLRPYHSYPATRDFQLKRSISVEVHFEELALETAPTRPRLWKRCVDDTFCILRKGSTEELLHHLNGVRPNIKFTVEREEDRKRMGHSCSSTRYSEGERMAAWTSLSTGSPRTRTGIASHHPTHVKRGVVRCLHDRARVLKQNGYPANLIHNASAPPMQETADMHEQQ